MLRIHNDMRAIIDNLLDLDAQDVSCKSFSRIIYIQIFI